MVALTIKEVNQYGKYVLVGQNVKTDLIFEFIKINTPKVGDKVLIHEKLLNKNSSFFTQPYSFEINQEYKPEEIKNMDDMEYAVLKSGGKYIPLKRVYG